MDQLVQILAQIQELSTVALEALEAALGEGGGGGEAPPGEGAPPEGPPPGAGPPPEEPAP